MRSTALYLFRKPVPKFINSRVSPAPAMYLTNEKGNSTLWGFCFWDGWPSDRHTDNLPMMNSVAWPVGEYHYNFTRKIMSKLSKKQQIFPFSGIGSMNLLLIPLYGVPRYPRGGTCYTNR